MKLAVSSLVAVAVAVIVSLIAGVLAHGLGPATAWFSLLSGLAVGVAAWFSIRRSVGTEPPNKVRGWVQWSVVTLFTLFALRAFCWLIFFKDGDLAFLSPNNLGDLSLHLTYSRYFANGAPFWPENPIYSGTGLHYPFGVDLLNSLLNLAGLDLYRSLVWVGLLGSLATGMMLWRWGGAFAMAGFLFNGGIAGLMIFSKLSLADYQDSMAWKSIPLALFITQRGLLYAIPAGLALLWSWQSRLLRRERGLPLWVEVLLYATMPIFHLHTFIFLSAMLAYWLLFPCRAPVSGEWQRWPARAEVLRIILPAILPASALVWMLTGGFKSGSAIHWKPGWLQEDQNPFLFWFENFGFLPLAVAAMFYWLSRRRRNPDLAVDAAVRGAVVRPALLVFLVTCFVMFAPWEWDNTKLMIWSYLAMLPSLWAMLREFHPGLRVVACVCLFFSGFVSLVGGLDRNHRGYPLAKREELDSLELSLRGIPITATFACVPTFNHPLLVLGHKAVAGYDGHLMSHGINYAGRFAELGSLMRGEPGWPARAASLGVDYLFWGEREQSKYPDSLTPWKEGVPIAAQGTWGTLYDLRKRNGEMQ